QFPRACLVAGAVRGAHCGVARRARSALSERRGGRRAHWRCACRAEHGARPARSVNSGRMAGPFSVEVDHVFVCTTVGAPEAQRLIDLGLIEGSANRHPGQGTANRRFFFANAMLELLWVEDEAKARSEVEPARRLHLWERWSERNGAACPFGVCLRPSEGRSD